MLRNLSGVVPRVRSIIGMAYLCRVFSVGLQPPSLRHRLRQRPPAPRRGAAYTAFSRCLCYTAADAAAAAGGYFCCVLPVRLLDPRRRRRGNKPPLPPRGATFATICRSVCYTPAAAAATGDSGAGRGRPGPAGKAGAAADLAARSKLVLRDCSPAAPDPGPAREVVPMCELAGRDCCPAASDPGRAGAGRVGAGQTRPGRSRPGQARPGPARKAGAGVSRLNRHVWCGFGCPRPRGIPARSKRQRAQAALSRE